MKAIEDVSTETTWIRSHIVPDNTFIAMKNITYEPIGEVKNCRDYIKRNNVVYAVDNVAFEPVSIGSTCPWYFVRNIDPNRIPRVITEAECACKCCGKPDHQCNHNRCSISHKPKLCQKSLHIMLNMHVNVVELSNEYASKCVCVCWGAERVESEIEID
ncbi:unnamed protein product [Mytilus coruscus]|uniref:Uncharacterized protein n=1 Tax=Mytilus coruscus TaxID=42192 RepID=A0A6J8BGK6_MYTCO|nr:unnamed protein product [Mytilus coruscus]